MGQQLEGLKRGPSRADQDPLGIEEFWDWLDRIGVPFTVGMLLAGGFSFATHRLGGRWTWPLLGLPVAGLVALVSLDYAFVGAATLIASAAVVGHWQTEAKRPQQKFRRRSWTSSALLGGLDRGPIARKRWRAQRVQGNRYAIGVTPLGRVVTVPFGLTDGLRAFFVGAPGSGKTVDLIEHALAYIRSGMGCVAIDPKGDRKLRDALARIARETGRRFLEWSPDGLRAYNPLARGSALEVADKALAGEQWTEPHYLRQAQRYLNLALETMQAAGVWPADLKSLVTYMDPQRLEELADSLDDELGQTVSAYVNGLSARSRYDLEGARNRLAVLAESRFGPLLCPGEDREEIELRSALEEGAIVYFRLDADRFPLASQMLGAAIVSDLVSLTGELQSAPLRAVVIIDEFSAVVAEAISRMLSRSRAAGLNVFLGTQALADLSLVRPGDVTDSFRRQVLSHVDYVVAHRQSEPEAAELLGQMAGTRPAQAIAYQMRRTQFGMKPTGEAATRDTREFIRHPDEFKNLGVGEAIVMEAGKGKEAELVRVWSSADSVSSRESRAPDGLRRLGLRFRFGKEAE